MENHSKENTPGMLSPLAWLFLLLLLSYLVLWCSLSALPYLDYPNNLTRAYIISKLLYDPATAFADTFVFHPSFRPHILGDIIISQLLRILPLHITAIFWVVCSFLSLPLALLFYISSVSTSRNAKLMVLFLSLYLSSDWFFLTGFFNFKIAVALCFVALGAWFRIRRDISRATFWLALYVTACVTCFLMHLAGFFFLGITVVAFLAADVLQNKFSGRRSLQTMVPLVTLGIVYIVAKSSHHNSVSQLKEWITFRPPWNKLQALGTMFVRFDINADILLFLGFVLLLAFASRWRISDRPHLVAATVLLLAFLTLPVAIFNIYDVDSRALPFFFIMLTIAAVSRGPIAAGTRLEIRAPLVLGSALLSVANFAYLAHWLPPRNAYLLRYQEALDAIPGGKTVLPVSTLSGEGRIETTAHAAALYSVRHNGITPYLFSASTFSPANYFDYRKFPYAPTITWYVRERDKAVNWERVIGTYDYLIITKPFDPARIVHLPLAKIFSNSAATVYAIAHSEEVAPLQRTDSSGTLAEIKANTSGF